MSNYFKICTSCTPHRVVYRGIINTLLYTLTCLCCVLQAQGHNPILSEAFSVDYVNAVSTSLTFVSVSFVRLDHQENMSVKCVPHQIPILYSKTGVCRGLAIFSYFCSKTKIVDTR